MSDLIGIGVYTSAEAARLLSIPAAKIRRWLRGHTIAGKHYKALWTSEIDLGDDALFLGFRDLMEIRVAQAFIREGISAIRVRRAIEVARELLQTDHPLSTNRFRTDGREIFLQVIDEDETGQQRERLIGLFRQQYEFNGIIDPILKTIDFGENGRPMVWWPLGRNGKIAVDPLRSFGQPIESISSVPTSVLRAAAKQEGIKGAAIAFDVAESSIRRAVDFERTLEQRQAA